MPNMPIGPQSIPNRSRLPIEFRPPLPRQRLSYNDADRVALSGAGAVGLAGLNIWAQAVRLTGEPRHDSGQSIIGAYEGWFPDTDGSFSLLVGYYNRNFSEEVDIPIGPDNKIEPGGPDQGQPTHFYPGRGWGNFVVRVPRDFGDKKLIWTITANGKTTTRPFGLESLWEISPMSEIGMGNTSPALRLDGGGPTVQEPAPRIESVSAKVGVPLTRTALMTGPVKPVVDFSVGGRTPI